MAQIRGTGTLHQVLLVDPTRNPTHDPVELTKTLVAQTVNDECHNSEVFSLQGAARPLRKGSRFQAIERELKLPE